MPTRLLASLAFGVCLLVHSATAQLVITAAPPATTAADHARPVPVSDLDGDGLRDFALLTPAGNLEFYSSRDFSMQGAPLSSHVSLNLGWGASYAGGQDLDGDGVLDLVVSAPGTSTSSCGSAPGQDRIFIYSGATRTLVQSWSTQASLATYYGAEVAMVGDLNGDGLGDVLVSTSACFGSSHWADVRSGLDGTVLRTHGANPFIHFADLGDVDGDGLNDYLISDYGFIGTGGRIRAFSGATGTLLYELLGASQEAVGQDAIETIGDVNGDGKNDFAYSGLGLLRVASGADGTLIHEFLRPQSYYLLGNSLAALGDVNADGVPDFCCLDGNGSIVDYVVFSGATGLPILSLSNPPFTNPIGMTRALALGDVNGDGHDDFVANWAVQSFSGRALYRPAGASTVMDLDWTASTPGSLVGTITATGAGPGQPGYLGVGNATMELQIPGTPLWILVDPALLLPITFDASGNWSLGVDLGLLPPMIPFHAQAFTLPITGWPSEITNRLSVNFAGT